MSEQSSRPQRPTTDDRDTWKAYWAAQGMPWRTEPEIDEERQQYLAERRTMRPNYQRTTYPFAGLCLTRADIEWLLVTHEDQGVHGPVMDDTVLPEPANPPDLGGVNMHDVALGLLLRGLSGQGQVDAAPDGSSQELNGSAGTDDASPWRWGLDLRGADVRGINLSCLPLQRTWGGLFGDWWREASDEQRMAAAVQLDGAILDGAGLQRAYLRNANLRGTRLRGTMLQSADLREAILDGADLRECHCTGTNFFRATLRAACLSGAYVSRAEFRNADLTDANLAGAILWGAAMRGAHLQRVNLEGANVQRVDLTGADARGANLRNADLRGAIVTRVKLDEADLAGADLTGATGL